MVSHLFYYQRALLALVWLCVLLPGAASRREAPIPPTATAIKPKSTRSNAPKPCAGLPQKPHCALCEQDVPPLQVPSAVGRVPSANG